MTVWKCPECGLEADFKQNGVTIEIIAMTQRTILIKCYRCKRETLLVVLEAM